MSVIQRLLVLYSTDVSYALSLFYYAASLNCVSDQAKRRCLAVGVVNPIMTVNPIK